MGHDACLCEWFCVWICDLQTRRVYSPMTHRELHSKSGQMAPFGVCVGAYVVLGGPRKGHPSPETELSSERA